MKLLFEKIASKTKINLRAILAILILGLLVNGCSSFGTRPNEEEKLYQSKQYNKEKGGVENRRSHVIEEMRENLMDWGTSRNGLVKEWIVFQAKNFQKLGQIVNLKQENKLETWWQQLFSYFQREETPIHRFVAKN